jgi:GntR family transcriptional regulator
LTPTPGAEAIAAFMERAMGAQDDSRPLYRRLRDALAEATRLEVAGPSGSLPSERWLAGRLGVSRVTLRRAMDELATDGLLSRRQGARTVVARRVEKMLSALTGFSDELRARGIEPGQRWISRRTVSPSPSEALALGLSPSDSIVRLVRVRLADGQPIAIERAAVPQAILPSGDLVTGSLYEALGRLGSPPVRGVQRIRAGLMTRVDAELLESDPGGPLLIVERRCFLADGQPVEFTETRYNGESYDFLTELGA